MHRRQPLPADFMRLSEEESTDRIARVRRDLRDRVVILGHHYQRESVIRFADFRGDSLKLAQLAVSRSDAAFIVFCGVHFMAESADMLRAPHQKVILPDLTAGCPMADMADLPRAERCWAELNRAAVWPVIPITYINSSARIKAFTGRHGGIVCTSSNARAILEWAFRQAPRILFLPDQHLGRNTARAMGIPPEEILVWDPDQPQGGHSTEALRRARVLLWKGHCYVHQMFKISHVRHFQNQDPPYTILVHPECAADVVQAADMAGSTGFIVETIRQSAPGSRWAIGTEIHLVERLAREYPDRTIVPLTRFGAVCATMSRIDPPHLLWVLEAIAAGSPVNVIRVPEEDARDARLALQRMLDHS
ncbi:MAG: quinolinate synthase NadA [Acidobacteria bacterium]|nr:quinolinate synthase NadA [Acidobacteriota bacterium]